MGIFSIMKGTCDKCGKMTLWNGPFSDCGCYSPPGSPLDIENKPVPDLMESELIELKKVKDSIWNKLIKKFN